MDVLNTGFTGELRLSDSAGRGYEEELELLSGAQSDIFSLNHSPSYSSNESGITSPGTLLDDDFLDDLDDLISSIPSKSQPLSTLTTVPSSQERALVMSNESSASTHDPKVRLCLDGQRLSEGQIERNRKNAIAARMNRQKKKEHLVELEEQVKSLSQENSSLSERCLGMEGTIDRLQQEVIYLKSVLVNESSLSCVLSGLSNIKGVHLQLPGAKRPREYPEQERAGVHTKKVKTEYLQPSGGICLHIAGEIASLEMCSQCSMRAGSTTTTINKV